MKHKHGFLLGKFMPPHAGHLSIIQTAQALVDELTILVCWLPNDPIPGELRLAWMRSLCPGCRVVGFDKVVPQLPEESPEFWSIWRSIVAEMHPEPIDMVFAGESYGARLAREVGGFFVPLGNRVLGAGSDRMGQISSSAIRANPVPHWPLLPPPVQAHYRKRLCLHGSESTGKSTLAALLAAQFDTIWTGEYGRSHCEVHSTELTLADLSLIANAQQAMNDAADQWAGPVLIEDTDALMTAAWTEMLLGVRPAEMMSQPKADLYLLMEPDIPWIDDGTRFFATQSERRKFAEIVERVLVDAKAPYVRVSGTWAERERTGRSAFEKLLGALTC